jgi:histidine-containing phosphotransfer protein
MAGVVAAQQQQLLASMQQEGLLDDQFQQLLALQDESNPDFVTEVAELYFDDAVPKITRVGQLLSEPAPDFAELDAVVHQFKGSSASLGAGGMAKLCIRMRELCQQRDVAGCQALVMQVRRAAAGGGAAAGERRPPPRRLVVHACTRPAWAPARLPGSRRPPLRRTSRSRRCAARRTPAADATPPPPCLCPLSPSGRPADAGALYAPEAAAPDVPPIGGTAQAAAGRRRVSAPARAAVAAAAVAAAAAPPPRRSTGARTPRQKPSVVRLRRYFFAGA